MRAIRISRVALALFFVLATINNFAYLLLMPFLYGASDVNPVDHSLSIIILWEVIYLTLTFWAAKFALKNIKEIKYSALSKNVKTSFGPYAAWFLAELIVFCLIWLTWDKHI
jgi:quinol-cytochrome oxidoreductase complex cytochrome b subunit